MPTKPRSRTRSAPAPRRCAIYTRISKDEKNDELGVRRQQKLCQELTAKLGWDVVEVFCDNNLSAFKAGRRPRYDAMIEAVRSGRIDAICVYQPERLSRDDLRGLEDLIDLLNAFGVEVQTVRSGEFDLSTSTGRGHARMAGVFARMESERMSERLKDKHKELAAAGKPNGGTRPFGYRRVGAKMFDGTDTRAFEPDPDEAPYVVEIIRRVSSGETLTRIADWLNEGGVTTVFGRRWDIGGVRKVALNPRYANLRRHNGVEVGPGTWPALVDEDTWRRAVAVLTDESRPKRRSARRYLLTGGLLRCGNCGDPLFSKPHYDRNGIVRARYVCRPSTQGGCGGVGVGAEPIEDVVTEVVISRIETKAFARELSDVKGERKGVAKDVRALEAQLDHVADSFSAGRITEREWMRVRDGIAKRLDDARADLTADTALSAVGPYAGKPGALRRVWEDLSLDVRQSIVRSVLDHVVIKQVPRGRSVRMDVADRIGKTVWRA